MHALNEQGLHSAVNGSNCYTISNQIVHCRATADLWWFTGHKNRVQHYEILSCITNLHILICFHAVLLCPNKTIRGRGDALWYCCSEYTSTRLPGKEWLREKKIKQLKNCKQIKKDEEKLSINHCPCNTERWEHHMKWWGSRLQMKKRRFFSYCA